MPYVNQYVEFRDGTIANLGGFSSAQAWFVSVVRPIAASKGLVIPDDVTDLPAYIQQMVADGKAQLKQYEDGLVQLAEAEKAIAAGEAQLRDAEKQLAQGEVDLANGGNQLADGKKQLGVFEDGCAQVAAGCELLMSQPAYMNDEGNGDKKMCPSVADILKERYGDNFSIWELDDNGEIRVVNGCQYLNLENCRAVGQAGKDYIEVYQTGAVTKEVMGRLGVVATMLIASVLGLIAGLFGILSVIRISKGKIVTASVCGIISAVIAAAGNVIGMLTGYTGYTFACRYGEAGAYTYEFTGHTQFVAIVILAIVAILFAIIACVVSGAYKRSQKAVAAQAAAAAAPVAVPVAEPAVAPAADDKTAE